MLTNAMFLAIFSVILEMFMVTKQPAIRHFFTKHEIIGMGFSFALSVALGEVFGAQGLIAMMGGIFSTVMTTMIYKMHLLVHYDHYKKNEEEIKLKVKETKDLVIRSAKFWFRLFTAPIRFINWIKKQINRATSAARSLWLSLSRPIQRYAGRAKRAHS